MGKTPSRDEGSHSARRLDSKPLYVVTFLHHSLHNISRGSEKFSLRLERKRWTPTTLGSGHRTNLC